MYYTVTARHKYMVTTGVNIAAENLEKTVASYVSRGYTVERITEQKGKLE